MKENFNYNKNKNEFTKEMINDTLKYQKQYNFNIGKNNEAWNNEADAFRHTYMQGILAKRYGMLLTKTVSDGHEWVGKLHHQDPRESNMDLWNNQQGIQIYNEILREYPNFKSLPKNQQKDIIAQKVIQRMRAGKLITDINDTRRYNDKPTTPFIPTRGIGGIQNNGVPTGFATSIEAQQSSYSGYTNPLTGNNRIFTQEDVGAMSSKEFAKNEKEIDSQIRAFNGTMPTNRELQNETLSGGGVVYVKSYTRSDGSQVKGYYRSR